jgi:hypothetical protein
VSEYLKRDNLRTVLDDESVRIGAQLMARMMRDICKGMSVIHKYAHTRHTTHDTRHTTHDTRHTTHDTRHTTHDTRHTTQSFTVLS